MISLKRTQLLNNLAQMIVRLPQDHPQIVAIDGVDGAGKTTFADQLAEMLKPLGREVIRASVDNFHNPRAIRYRQGRASPAGFFEDSYNYEVLKALLLDPLSPTGSKLYRLKAFDCASDAPIADQEKQAASCAILIIDGIFLHRPDLCSYWDFSVFLDVDFSISFPRGANRGAGFGSPDLLAESNRRYLEGQQLYLRTCRPHDQASIAINNNDLDAPEAIFRGACPALWEALAFGIDVSALEANLALSCNARLENHGAALNLVRQLREAGERQFKT